MNDNRKSDRLNMNDEQRRIADSFSASPPFAEAQSEEDGNRSSIISDNIQYTQGSSPLETETSTPSNGCCSALAINASAMAINQENSVIGIGTLEGSFYLFSTETLQCLHAQVNICKG